MPDQTLKVQDGAVMYDIAHQFPDGTRGIRVGIPGGGEGMGGAMECNVGAIGVLATKIPSSPLANRKHLIVQNQGPYAVYLGTASVNTSSKYGYILYPHNAISIDLSDDIDLYGIAEAITYVSCLEFS